MVNIKVNGEVVIFEVAGWDKLWAFKSSLEIPVQHITDVYADPNPALAWFDGIKIIGTGIPTILMAGTFYQEGEFVFWDVHNARNTIIVELMHEHFSKLVIEVAEPDSAVSTIRNAIYARKS